MNIAWVMLGCLFAVWILCLSEIESTHVNWLAKEAVLLLTVLWLAPTLVLLSKARGSFFYVHAGRVTWTCIIASGLLATVTRVVCALQRGHKEQA